MNVQRSKLARYAPEAHCVREQVDPVVLDDQRTGKRVAVVLAMRRVHLLVVSMAE